MKFKNIKTVFSILLICLVFIVLQTSQVSAFSVKELLGLGKTESETEAKKETKPESKPHAVEKKSQNSEWAKTSDKDAAANPQINLEYVSLLVANMNEKERTKILTDPEIFKQVIESEANNRSVVSAAIANNLVQDRNVEFLMRRGAENILRETYLKKLILSKLPKDFPSTEQVTEYYKKNKSQFVLPERVHVWQIFFAKPANASEKEIEVIKRKANKIIADIKNGKADFSSVALSQSEHEQSKVLGGYMGLLKTSELLPAIKEPLLKLKEGELSAVVESESGFHILKRGKILKAEPLELSQVETQIKKALINQVNTQLRKAIFTEARKEYPQDIPDSKLEEWRLRLKTNTNQ